MNELTAVVIGASGLTGGYVVEELLKDDAFGIVRILVRSPVQVIHNKLHQEVVNFDDINDFTKKFGEGDLIFCCIGTTQKKVKGDKSAYERIDFKIPFDAAGIGIAKNYKKFLVVSSVGADEHSSNFYLKLKGKTENAISQFGFESIYFMRPSMLLGARKELRRGEKFLQAGTKALSLLFFGSLKKYHAIQAIDVARAMVKESKKNNPGVHYLEYTDIMKVLNE